MSAQRDIAGVAGDLEILAIGAGATMQDQGRPGYAALGVGRSGAFDRPAAALANRLVGNDPSEAVIEVVLGGLALRAAAACTIALVGAVCEARAARPVDWGAPVALRAGEVLRLGSPRVGLRSWLAVRGGIAVEAVLGSRSADSLSGLGPAPLRAGDRLPIGPRPPGVAPGVDWTAPPVRDPALVRVDPGPRLDWLDPGAWRQLRSSAWTVRPDSDRIGLRLDGPPLARRRAEELPSEGMTPGAIQVPPDGRPIVVGPDGPVTGGYPVIGVVREEDLAVLAQLRPGDPLRLAG